MGLANSGGLDLVGQCAKRRNPYQILCCVGSCFQPAGIGHVLGYTRYLPRPLSRKESREWKVNS
jgi:hypothetical protein